jgi:hypothetical protein
MGALGIRNLNGAFTALCTSRNARTPKQKRDFFATAFSFVLPPLACFSWRASTAAFFLSCSDCDLYPPACTRLRAASALVTALALLGARPLPVALPLPLPVACAGASLTAAASAPKSGLLSSI